MRLYLWLANTFSLENCCQPLAVYLRSLIFVRMHRSLRVSPAMAPDVSDQLSLVRDPTVRLFNR